MTRFIFLVCLLLFVGAVYFLMDEKDHAKMSELTAERAFSLEEINNLQKIVITEKNKKSIVLNKNKDDSWQLNAKYLARKNAVDNLIEVIEQVQIKYIPEQAATKNIVNEMRTIGVQVDLYNDGDELLKSYQVGGATQDERGTYMMMNTKQGLARPFVVNIPSIEGSVRGRFILSEIDWRDRAIIKEDVSKLNFIKVEYSGNAEESFIIKTNDGSLKVYDAIGNKEIDIDKNIVNAYIQGFDQVYAEYIDNSNPFRDSIAALVPFTTISYGSSEKATKTIKLFPLSDLLYENGGKVKMTTMEVGGRYFIDCSWGDFMLAQNRLIGKLLRGKSFFELK